MLLLLLLFAMNWQYIRKQRQKQFLKFRVLVRFSDSFGHFRQRLCIRIYSKNVRNIFGIPGTLKTKTSLIGSQKLKSQWHVYPIAHDATNSFRVYFRSCFDNVQKSSWHLRTLSTTHLFALRTYVFCKASKNPKPHYKTINERCRISCKPESVQKKLLSKSGNYCNG